MTLPAETERAVRLTAVPPHLRRVFSLLPSRLEIRVLLPTHDRLLARALGARQLLKLGLLGVGARLAAIETGDELVVALSLRDKSAMLYAATLESDLSSVLPALFASLLLPGDVSDVLDRLAFQSSAMETLREITGRMMAAREREDVHRLLLVGLTSGYGLGFHRAAMLLWDEELRGYRGVCGVGPDDETEAHRIWESIELEDAPVDRLVDSAQRWQVGRFETRVRELLLPIHEQLVARSLAGSGPRAFDRAAAAGTSLERLDLGATFVLGPCEARGGIGGLVFADDRFGEQPLTSDRLAHMSLFLDHTSLVLSNLSLLDRVSTLARTDPLTGLLNRRELETRLELERARSEREQRPLGLLVIDVDHFKQVNDRAGHSAGDELLRQIATILRHSLQLDDPALACAEPPPADAAIARFGGDEFVVVLPGAGQEQVSHVARRIGSAAQRAGVSISLGGASWPETSPAIAELFERADEALFQAKQQGRGCGFVATRVIHFERRTE